MTRNESFDDVLTMLLLEEPGPTDEALARWSERYPQYREDLAGFFETWAMTEKQTGPEPDTDEDEIVEQSVKQAMESLERQGRLNPVKPVQQLAPYDDLVLTAVYLLGGKGYPSAITGKVGEISGSPGVLGSVFNSLNRLEDQGMVLSRPADPVSEPENKTRRYYTVTMAGARALAHAKEVSTIVARFLPDLA